MFKDIKSLVKSAVQTAQETTYHQGHAKNALKALKSLQKQGVKLHHADKKRSKEYAIEVLGHQRYAPWLEVYTAMAGEFREGWIPDNYYGWVVVPKISGGYGLVSNLNSLNVATLRSDSFPDVLSYVNGVFFDRDYRFVPKQDVANRLFKDQERVVYKIDNSLMGRGIYAFSKDTFDVEEIPSLGNGLFQGFIQQHGFFDVFTKHSVATIRMTTVFEASGDVSLRACYLRLGNEKETHVQTRTSNIVSVNLETGSLDDVGYKTGWVKTRIHPTSRVEFAGLTIPNFKACREKVMALHQQVPYSRCIGWDVTVDHEEKIKVMEWNSGHNGIKFSESTQGPCFADLGWSELHH